MITEQQKKEVLDYIHKYAVKHGITEEEAKNHLMVKAYENWKADSQK